MGEQLTVLPFHPLADLFPLIEGAAFDELVSSIRDNGQREAIVMLDGAVLDGRNRYRGCLAAGIEPRFVEFDGLDPVKFVVDLNVHRRHLNESQRALIAANLATIKLGENQHTNEGASIDAPSQEQAGKLLNVSRSAVQRARAVLESADEQDIAAIRHGDASVSGVVKKLREKRNDKKRKAKMPRRTEQPAIQETQHDRDLSYLRGAWDGACPSARREFLRALGYELKEGLIIVGGSS